MIELLQKYGLKVLPFVGVLVVGSVAGWYAKPAVVQTKTEEKTKEVQVTTDAQKELSATLARLEGMLQRSLENQTNEKFHQEVTETQAVDGSKTKKTVTDKNVDSHTLEKETKTVVQVVKVEVEKEKVVVNTVEKEVVKTVESTPVLEQWAFNVQVGVQPQFLPTPQVNAWVVGGSVEHRVIGPFWAGIWVQGTTTGQVSGGVQVGVKTK